MEPITNIQEWTLRNWVATFRRRPNKLEKTFLSAEKGLSEGQIDAWFENEGNCPDHESLSAQVPQLPQKNAIWSKNELSQSLGDCHGSSFYIDTGSFDTGSDLMDYIPTQAASWLAEIPTSGISDFVPQSDLWDGLKCFDNGVLSPVAPSLVGARALLTESSVFNPHLTYMSDTDTNRSSGFSSQTWGTTSSTLSNDLDYHRHSYRTSKSLSMFSPIAEESEDWKSQRDDYDEYFNALSPRSFTKPSKVRAPGVYQKHEKDKGSWKYVCTDCEASFQRKGDWERHEASTHDPQTYWTCMLLDPAIQTLAGWTCAFCEIKMEERGAMDEHLLSEHATGGCCMKRIISKNRTWTRKDKLKQHLQQVHRLGEGSRHWEAWQHAPRKKFAWGCGYCGACLFTWEGRLSHIASHYENPSSNIGTWSLSLVVKGLLKQCQADFNVASFWKQLVGSGSSVEGKLAWADKDALSLKGRLEYHKDTAQLLAEEARRLAVFHEVQGRKR